MSPKTRRTWKEVLSIAFGGPEPDVIDRVAPARLAPPSRQIHDRENAGYLVV